MFLYDLWAERDVANRTRVLSVRGNGLMAVCLQKSWNTTTRWLYFFSVDGAMDFLIR